MPLISRVFLPYVAQVVDSDLTHFISTFVPITISYDIPRSCLWLAFVFPSLMVISVWVDLRNEVVGFAP